jgi:hypothetical protein
MVQGAVYDAVNAIEPKHHRPYLLKRRFAATASKDAAVATAAYDVLSNIISTVPASIPFPTRASLLQSLATQYAASLAAIPDRPFKAQGIAAGKAAADAMIAARQDDGRFGPSQWVPNPAPGHWQPLVNPTTGLPILDPTPWVGGVKPFVMVSSSQFRTAGPQPLASAAYAADFNEVKELGAANSSVRTGTQTYIARWWQSTPVASWNAVARDLVTREDLDAADTARLLAMQNLSGADASINCWNDKYYWDFWRPWNAIPRAAEDGNPATTPDPTWTALITAPYPEHPSGISASTAAHIGVLRMFFGDAIDGGFQITQQLHLPSPGDPPRAASRASRRRSRRSSRPASGQDFTTAQRTYRRASRQERRPLPSGELLPAGRPARLTTPGCSGDRCGDDRGHAQVRGRGHDRWDRASRRSCAVPRLPRGLNPGLVHRLTPAVVEVHQRPAARVPNSWRIAANRPPWTL